MNGKICQKKGANLMDTKQIIEKIVALDEKIASLQESFDEQSEDERLEVLTGLYRQELAKIGEDDQVPFVLARYSGLLTGITWPVPAWAPRRFRLS
jgi:hypothetical protein